MEDTARSSDATNLTENFWFNALWPNERIALKWQTFGKNPERRVIVTAAAVPPKRQIILLTKRVAWPHRITSHWQILTIRLGPGVLLWQALSTQPSSGTTTRVSVAVLPRSLSVYRHICRIRNLFHRFPRQARRCAPGERRLGSPSKSTCR